jgi:hypothetical protein
LRWRKLEETALWRKPLLWRTLEEAPFAVEETWRKSGFLHGIFQ